MEQTLTIYIPAAKGQRFLPLNLLSSRGRGGLSLATTIGRNPP